MLKLYPVSLMKSIDEWHGNCYLHQHVFATTVLKARPNYYVIIFTNLLLCTYFKKYVCTASRLLFFFHVCVTFLCILSPYQLINDFLKTCL